MLNRLFRIMSLVPYLVSGAVMWLLMLKFGVHATIAGVLLAFAIPFSAKEDDEKSPSHRLEHFLNKPVTFVILPIFALANTGIRRTLETRELGHVLAIVLIGINLLSNLVTKQPRNPTIIEEWR